MAKIVFTGSECSGKTTLALAISKKYDITYVPEIAREYLTVRNNQYDFESLSEIAFLQRWQEIVEFKTNPIICCDTDLMTIMIWSMEKFHRIDKNIFKLWQESLPDVYVLCTPDMTWISDPQRENPHDRDRLFEVYRTFLENHKLNYFIVSGDLEQRILQTESKLQYMLNKLSD